MTTTSLPPGPRGAFVQSARYMRDPYGYTRAVRRRFGDLVTLPTLNGTVVLSFTTEGAREILAGREDDFVVDFGTQALAPVIGSGSLLLLSGERHRRERKLLSPVFHGARMRATGPTVQRIALREVEAWEPGARICAQERMAAVSMEVILRSVFGASGHERVGALRDAIRRGVAEVSPAVLFFRFLQRDFGGFGPWAAFRRRMRVVDALIQERIDEARRTPEPGDDVLSALVAARRPGAGAAPLSDREVRDHLLTLLVAGHETTATALAWSLYELARHPEVRDRLRDEIASLGPDPTPEALSGLAYLDAFCHEVLRRHPIVAEFFRTVREGFALQGFDVTPGVSVGASILEIHRDPALYPEPDRFRPERFLGRRFAPYEFVAFGGGHRHCLGAAFALHEMKVVLGTLVPRVELALEIDRPLGITRRNVTLAPEAGVPLRVTRRLPGTAARAA